MHHSITNCMRSDDLRCWANTNMPGLCNSRQSDTGVGNSLHLSILVSKTSTMPNISGSIPCPTPQPTRKLPSGAHTPAQYPCRLAIDGSSSQLPVRISSRSAELNICSPLLEPPVEGTYQSHAGSVQLTSCVDRPIRSSTGGEPSAWSAHSWQCDR